MGAFTYGEPAGKAEIACLLVTICKLEKMMTNGTTTANNLEVAMDVSRKSSEGK